MLNFNIKNMREELILHAKTLPGPATSPSPITKYDACPYQATGGHHS